MMKNVFLKAIYLLAVFMFTKSAFSQVEDIEIGIDGLTCSQCTRNVELSIRKLDFVADVIMNLENTEGKITLKKDSKIVISDISKAIFDAGFSVRFITVSYNFKQASIKEGFCFEDENAFYLFVKVDSAILNGKQNIKILGEKYQNRKEFKQWKHELKGKCDSKEKQFYYVTI